MGTSMTSPHAPSPSHLHSRRSSLQKRHPTSCDSRHPARPLSLQHHPHTNKLLATHSVVTQTDPEHFEIYRTPTFLSPAVGEVKLEYGQGQTHLQRRPVGESPSSSRKKSDLEIEYFPGMSKLSLNSKLKRSKDPSISSFSETRLDPIDPQQIKIQCVPSNPSSPPAPSTPNPRTETKKMLEKYLPKLRMREQKTGHSEFTFQQMTPAEVLYGRIKEKKTQRPPTQQVSSIVLEGEYQIGESLPGSVISVTGSRSKLSRAFKKVSTKEDSSRKLIRF